MTLALPDGPERPFLEFWAAHLLDPRDPQNERWRPSPSPGKVAIVIVAGQPPMAAAVHVCPALG